MPRQFRFLLALLVVGSLGLMGFSGPQQQSSQGFGTTSAFWLALLLVVILLGLLAWWAMRHETRPGLEAYLRPAAEAVRAAPAATAEANPEPTPKSKMSPAPAQVDDLKVIEGIGPKIAAVLSEAGIGTFAQLAAADPAEIERVIRAAGVRLGDPATWPEQAALAARGDWDGLAALQASLKGGRRVG